MLERERRSADLTPLRFGYDLPCTAALISCQTHAKNKLPSMTMGAIGILIGTRKSCLGANRNTGENFYILLVAHSTILLSVVSGYCRLHKVYWIHAGSVRLLLFSILFQPLHIFIPFGT